MSQDVHAGCAFASVIVNLSVVSSSGKSMLVMAAIVYENQPAALIHLRKYWISLCERLFCSGRIWPNCGVSTLADSV